MPAPILPLNRMQRARGEGRIAAGFDGNRTRLTTLYQDGCAKIRLPHTHDRRLDAVLINTAGGLTGGDRMDWGAEAGPDTQMLVTTQACERIYRSTGDTAEVRTRLSVGRSAHLDWLPQETILFEDSRLDRRIEIDLAPRASLTAVEAILLGRQAMGETARRAYLRDNWRVRRDSRLIHAEATLLGGKGDERDALPLLDGMHAFATILHITDDAASRLQTVRDLLPAGPIAASAMGERLVIRAMAPDGLALRRLIVPLITELSGAGSLPRLWTL